MKAWIIVTDDFKTYYAKEVEAKWVSYYDGVDDPYKITLNDQVGFMEIQSGALKPRISDVLGGLNINFWLTKEACESAIRGVMG